VAYTRRNTNESLCFGSFAFFLSLVYTNLFSARLQTRHFII